MKNWKVFYSNSKSNYEVSNTGEIRNSRTNTIYKLNKNTCGYSSIKIQGKWYLVHRLVAKYFIGDIENKVVNHLNNNTTDNRVKNLQITNQSENIKWCVKQNRHKKRNQYNKLK